MASKSTSHPLEVTSSMAANSTMVATKNAINSSLNNTQTTLAQNSTTTAADFANPPPLSSTRLLIDDGTTHPSLTGVEWVSAVDAVVANGPPPQPPPPAQCFKNLPPSEARLVLGTNFTCAEIGDWNTAAMAQKMPASWPDELRRLCQLFLNDVRQQCAERIRPPLTTYQMVGAVETFYHTFAYAVNARASSTQEVIDFFQQQLLRYAVEHVPQSMEVFDLAHSWALLQLFSSMFLPHHLVLLRAVTVPSIVVETRIVIEAKKGKK